MLGSFCVGTIDRCADRMRVSGYLPKDHVSSVQVCCKKRCGVPIEEFRELQRRRKARRLNEPAVSWTCLIFSSMERFFNDPDCETGTPVEALSGL